MFVIPYVFRAYRLYSIFKIHSPSAISNNTLVQDSPRVTRQSFSSDSAEYTLDPTGVQSSGSLEHLPGSFSAHKTQYDLLRWYVYFVFTPFVIISVVDMVYEDR
eukprot:UN03525